jgi:hypothetical protein
MTVKDHFIDELAIDRQGAHLATGTGGDIRVWRRNERGS